MRAADIRDRSQATAVWRSAAALLVAVVLGACSSTPEWADPTALWDKAFGEEEDARPADVADRPDEAERGFPTLGSTPEKPEVSSAEAREAVANALVADRDNARYTDETLRNQGGIAAPPQRPSASPPAAVAQAERAATQVARQAAPNPAPLPPPEQSAAVRAPATQALQSRAVAPSSDSSRMQVPSIVQRRGQPLPPPTPIEEVARGRGPLPIVQSRQTPQPLQVESMVKDAMDKETMESAMAEDKAAMTPPAQIPSATDVGRPMAADTMAPRLDSAAPSPAAMAAAANVNLPVGQDQSTLEQVFASQLAAQASGIASSRAVLPATTVVGGGGQGGQAFQPPPRANGTPLNLSSDAGSGDDLRLPGAPLIVRFDNASSSLGPSGRRQVDQAAQLARQRGGTVRVVGHASQRTPDMPYARHKIVNFNVSLDRANAVAAALAQRGIPRGSIIVEAKGDEEPLFYEFMPNGEAYNRRVEIFLQ